ncbi:intracellular growth attenuator family protein [Bradyrhizobium canariense]|uniref:intracellular growth attenuator family protein n=1 Tax=Bradyrhizobium canariense TaxID=255045 RepID=UPI001CA47DEC|nr:intracellular growth attenuator family protein [Bradyrhizobium canariense]MBW5440821.1 intracellular growth attenuator family protein [Bradyrhizobium canariense]
MEILDLKFAGVPIWLLLLIGCIFYNGRYAYREWRKDRDTARELDEAQRRFKAEHE